MGTGVEHIEKVCDLLALARRGGEDKEARGEKDRAWQFGDSIGVRKGIV
jgi:hypothetical protein